MWARTFSGLVISSTLMGSALVPLSGVLAPTVSIAASQVSSLAVQAAELALKGRYVDAGSLAQRSGDDAAIKLVELLYLKDHWKDAGYSRIMDFVVAAPKWPLSETLLKRAEQALHSNGANADVVLAHFAKRQPLTTEGMIALARAHRATGNQQAAQQMLRKVWSNTDVTAAMEKSILSEFGALLGAEDHRARMWQMVFAQESNAAIRNSKRLGGNYQAAAKVAQGLLRGVASADKQYDRLPSSMREQLGMKYALVNYLRKQERYSKARAVLATVPGTAAAMGDAEAWWIERRIVARHSIGLTHLDSAKAAYQIAKSHGFELGTKCG